MMRTLTRTCPSVLCTVEKTDIMPSVYYEGEISYSDYSPQYQPVLKLRNTKQIANLQHSHRQKFRFSHDGLYNVHELSYDHGGFLVPSFFLIHERKLQSSHEELMKIVADDVPALVKGKTKVPLVTDEELGICNSIDLHLLSVQRLQCWNHTISAAKVWLRNHNAASSEIPVYVSHLRDLFHQPSE